MVDKVEAKKWAEEILGAGEIRFRRDVHDLGEALEAADAGLELLHEGDEGVDGGYEEVYGDDEGGVVAEGDPSGVEEESAGYEDEHVEHVGDELVMQGGG